MVYFISEDNQNLLWNVIHNNASIQLYLKTMSSDDKSHWFRSIIAHFYKKYGPVDLSFYQLKSINKEVIIYIIQYIQKQNKQIQNQSLSNSFQQIQTPAYEKNNREEEYISQFEMRQKEYNQILDQLNDKTNAEYHSRY